MHATYPLQGPAGAEPPFPWVPGTQQTSVSDRLQGTVGMGRFCFDDLAGYPSPLTTAGPCYGFDPTLAYPYFGGYCSADARRKNATRESTSTLKAWLYEHRKNPYPTKGEKIMLAIITKMTLTQVSTWFANARRRLKKENKGEWGFKDTNDPEDMDDDDDIKLDGDAVETISSHGSEASSSSGRGSPSLPAPHHRRSSPHPSDSPSCLAPLSSPDGWRRFPSRSEPTQVGARAGGPCGSPSGHKPPEPLGFSRLSGVQGLSRMPEFHDDHDPPCRQDVTSSASNPHSPSSSSRDFSSPPLPTAPTLPISPRALSLPSTAAPGAHHKPKLWSVEDMVAQKPTPHRQTPPEVGETKPNDPPEISTCRDFSAHPVRWPPRMDLGHRISGESSSIVSPLMGPDSAKAAYIAQLASGYAPPRHLDYTASWAAAAAAAAAAAGYPWNLGSFDPLRSSADAREVAFLQSRSRAGALSSGDIREVAALQNRVSGLSAEVRDMVNAQGRLNGLGADVREGTASHVLQSRAGGLNNGSLFASSLQRRSAPSSEQLQLLYQFHVAQQQQQR